MSKDKFTVRMINYQNHSDSTLEFTPGVNVIEGGSNSGKCFVGETLVAMEKGYRMIKNIGFDGETEILVDGKNRVYLGVDGLSKVSHLYYNGPKKTSHVYTNSGDMLKCTPNEPLLVFDGNSISYKHVEDINLGEYLVKCLPSPDVCHSDTISTSMYMGGMLQAQLDNPLIYMYKVNEFMSTVKEVYKDSITRWKDVETYVPIDLNTVLMLSYGDQRDWVLGYLDITLETYASTSHGIVYDENKINLMTKFLDMYRVVYELDRFSISILSDYGNISPNYKASQMLKYNRQFDSLGGREIYMPKELSIYLRKYIQGSPLFVGRVWYSKIIEGSELTLREYRLALSCLRSVNPELLNLPSDMKLEKVIAIEEGPVVDVYDVCVPNGHQFLANNYRVHNTAILRAIETAIYNVPRADHVKLGETKCKVGIKYNDHTIIYTRDTSKASQVTYNIDGENYAKLGRGQSEIVGNLLGIEEVDLDGQKIRLNFQKQMAYPFLLDKTPSQLFKFIVSSSEKDNLLDVQNSMKEDLSQLTNDLKVKQELLESLNEQKISMASKRDAYKELVPVANNVVSSSLGREVEKLLENIANYSTKSRELARYQNELEETNKDLNILKGLHLGNVVFIESLLAYIKEYETRQRDKEESINNLNDINTKITNIDSVLTKSNVKNMTDMLDGINQLKETVNVYEETMTKSEETNNQLKEVNYGISSLNTIISDFNDKSARMNNLLADINKIKSLVDSYFNTNDKKLKVLDDIDTVEVVLNQVINELREFNVCPYCGNTLNN